MMLIIKTIAQLMPFIKESMGESDHRRRRRTIIFILVLLTAVSSVAIVMGKQSVTIYQSKMQCLVELERVKERVTLEEGKVTSLNDQIRLLENQIAQQQAELNFWRAIAKPGTAPE